MNHHHDLINYQYSFTLFDFSSQFFIRLTLDAKHGVIVVFNNFELFIL